MMLAAVALAQDASNSTDIKTDIIVEKSEWASYNQGGEDAIAPCMNPQGFHVVMCKSYMCVECVSDWCVAACQKWQKEYPTCRCPEWPESKTSYSTSAEP